MSFEQVRQSPRTISLIRIFLYKLHPFYFVLTSASVQTVTLYAFKSKALYNVLRDLSSFQLEMRNIQKFSRLFAAIFWSCLALTSFNSMYQMFAYEGPEIISDLMILPFNVYFDLKKEIVIFLKLVAFILTTISYASVVGANSFNLLISIILKHEFTKLRRKLEYMISFGDGGADETLNASKLDMKIELIKLRKHHQKLAKIVENADKFICLWNGCVIVAQVSIAILVFVQFNFSQRFHHYFHLYHVLDGSDCFTFLYNRRRNLCEQSGQCSVNICLFV